MNTIKELLTGKVVVAVIVSGLVGMAVGAGASTSDTKPASSTKPEITTVTSIVEKTVEVTPESCKRAIELARTGFDYSSQSMSIVSEAFTAIADLDFRTVENLTDDLGDITSKVTVLAPQFNAAASSCENS